MERGRSQPVPAGLGGIAASAPDVQDAASAVLVRMDWRPLVGLTEAHRGSLVELVLSQVVLDLVIEARKEEAK